MYQETELPEIFYHNLSLWLQRTVQRKKSEHKQCVQISVNRRSFMTLILLSLKAALWVLWYLIFLLNSSSYSHTVRGNSQWKKRPSHLWMWIVSWTGRGLRHCIQIARVQKRYGDFTLWFVFFWFHYWAYWQMKALSFGPLICIFSFVSGNPWDFSVHFVKAELAGVLLIFSHL